jgi:hypothetical protein
LYNGENPTGTPTALVPSEQGKNWSKKRKTKDKKRDQKNKEPTVLIPSRDRRKSWQGKIWKLNNTYICGYTKMIGAWNLNTVVPCYV